MSMGRSLSGGCPCGAVRFRTRGEPRDWVRCECGPCRGLSRALGRGEPVWPNAGVEFAGGEIASAEHACAADPRPMTLHFCAACGAPLSVSIDRAPATRCMLAATFDEPSMLHGAAPARPVGGARSATQ
jgi:hypothetical protein